MEFNTTEYKRGSVVKGVGRIDSATAPELEKVMTELIGKGKNIILDLEEVDFVSSAGWWSIIRVQKELKKSNLDLILVNLNENVRDSMDLIGILPYFAIYDNLVDAVASL
ncbi:MAG: STAS domain-containing protein [Chloroflexi bacterium]|nr:STAS domain-containing protein [Chloroflexota bacterium]